RNLMRSLLTILGIIIGVAAVIAMVSISQGAGVAVQEQIARMGNNMLIILSGSVTQGGVRTGAGGRSTLTIGDAKAIQRECPAVGAVTYTRRQVQQVVLGNQNWSTAILGVTPAYQTVRDWPLALGRFLSKQDDDSGATVAVLGQTVVDNLFGAGQNPLDQVIRIKNVPFRVIGVLTPKGQSTQGMDQDDTVLIPFTTAERKVIGASMLGTVGAIMVSAVSPGLIPEAERQIKALLRERHRLKRGQDDDFTVRNLADVAATAQSTSQSMSILLASVASVSLLVGGIGIMNIMLVSVTERTREIGIRLAIGAKRRDILTQFLLEAVVLSTIGGLCGVGFGVIGSQVVSSLAAWPAIVPVEAIVLAVVFSSAVGIFFGFYPARKAAHLDPIQALRYE
ncbi:MAG: FtsX-like permease family protein, partial [Candidatus Tectomicrobia bacterium]|nr:FtsX-like permease family protein [Candidatus Tectomicrobia bacterium]